METPSGKSISMVRLAMAVPGKVKARPTPCRPRSCDHCMNGPDYENAPDTTDLHLRTEEPESLALEYARSRPNWRGDQILFFRDHYSQQLLLNSIRRYTTF